MIKAFDLDLSSPLNDRKPAGSQCHAARSDGSALATYPVHFLPQQAPLHPPYPVTFHLCTNPSKPPNNALLDDFTTPKRALEQL